MASVDSVFDGVELAPPDVIFGLVSQYKADPHPNKINLIIGAYRTEDGEPYVLPVVRGVESAMAADKTLNHEYLPIDGMKDLSNAANILALGADCPAITENRIAAAQTLSGTGSLRIAFAFLKQHYTASTIVYISKPTWGNHKKILAHAGYTDIREYSYFDSSTKGLNVGGMLKDLESAPEGAIILLHSCAHNPCGVDPNKEEWQQIADVCERRKLFPLFDTAYQGFVSGDPDIDAWALRYFVSRGFEMIYCQSFAKIFGIYNERCGNIGVLCKNAVLATHVLSQLKAIIRPMYSNPPNHGARIVTTILNTSVLAAEWREQLKSMATRITSCRELLLEKLKAIETPGKWNHIVDQNGMFTFTGLSPVQVKVLQEKYHIYLLGSGRINVCAVNQKNVDYICQAIKDVVVNHAEK